MICVHADGCEISSHSELDIGELIDIPCPCHEYVWMLPDVGNQRARINCGGSYASGPELMDTDFSQCITVTDSITSSLCQVAMVISSFTVPSPSLMVYIHAKLFSPCRVLMSILLS